MSYDFIYNNKNSSIFMHHGRPACFQEPLLFKENRAHLTGGGRFFNASFQVSGCTSVGCGPWSPPVVVLPAAGTPHCPTVVHITCDYTSLYIINNEGSRPLPLDSMTGWLVP